MGGIWRSCKGRGSYGGIVNVAGGTWRSWEGHEGCGKVVELVGENKASGNAWGS